MLKTLLAGCPLLLALALATPAAAQATPDTLAAEVARAQPEASVDPALVGEWTLDEMTAPGVLAAYGVDVEEMTCTFSADGQAQVAMTAVQDGDPISRTRSFSFRTEDGEIIEDGDDPILYRILEDGSLELTDDEMVIRFARL